MNKIKVRGAMIAMLLIMAACVTVNIYFPAAEVQEAAEEIAKEVRSPEGATDQQHEPQAPAAEPRSRLRLVGVAYAQEPLNVSNATIRQIKARMKDRYPQLASLLQAGIIGEAANGLLVARDTSGLDLRSRAEGQRLVGAENGDRQALYQAVAGALNVDKSQLDRVQKIFAAEWQKTAPAGTWIEAAPGSWQRKG